jgi:hypothetical protein
MTPVHPEPRPAPDAQAPVIAVLGPVEMGLSIAAGDPRARVSVFAENWAEVDRARQLVRSRGLCARVAVHHRSAVGPAMPALRDLRRPA